MPALVPSYPPLPPPHSPLPTSPSSLSRRASSTNPSLLFDVPASLSTFLSQLGTEGSLSCEKGGGVGLDTRSGGYHTNGKGKSGTRYCGDKKEAPKMVWWQSNMVREPHFLLLLHDTDDGQGVAGRRLRWEQQEGALLERRELPGSGQCVESCFLPSPPSPRAKPSDLSIQVLKLLLFIAESGKDIDAQSVPSVRFPRTNSLVRTILSRRCLTSARP